MTAHVLITGGTGFVGAELVRRLAAGGRVVHVLHRATSDRSVLGDVAVRWHAADLGDGEALQRALTVAGSEARHACAALDVVHLAAAISYRRRDGGRLHETNVEGTRRMLAAARAQRVRRFCHVSSVVALGPVGGPGEALDDDAPLRARALDSAYARTKAEAEELVAAAARELDVVVASPAVVFGCSRAGSNSQHFVRRAVRGRLGPLSPPGSLTVVGLADAVQGIELVLERGRRGRRYLLGESTWRLHELLTLVSTLAGRPAPRAAVPPRAWRALVALAALLDRVVPSERATPEALALLGLHFCFRARRAREELGWAPRAFPAVLAEIVAATIVAETRAAP